LILKIPARHLAGLTSQRYSFTNSSNSSEALIETNDSDIVDHEDTLAHNDVIFLEPLPTSQRKPQCDEEYVKAQ